MTEIPESPAIRRWHDRFTTDPVAALAALLAGSVNLGPYNRAKPADALAQLLTQPEERDQADQALLAWLEFQLGKPAPPGLSTKRFADALLEAFRAVEHTPLPATRAWLANHQHDLRLWLRGFYGGPTRDPESALLLALAHGQTDRSLLGLWLGLTRLTGTVPLEQALIALTGLRLMPADDQGGIEHNLPLVLLRGLLELGDTLVRNGDNKGQVWLRELDFLAAVYPMSKEQWAKRFRTVIQGQGRPLSAPVQRWLDQRYPAANRPTPRKMIGRSSRELQPPHGDELRPLLPKNHTHLELASPQLLALLDRHRRYCQESGDSFYLIRAFGVLGDRLLDFNPVWARELAHEAARWAPNNPHPWSLLARALDKEGDWRRAEAVYWHARRRFPHNVRSHSQLAHSLLLHHEDLTAEAVLRQTILLFPDNPVCRNDLAHTLRLTGRGEEAVTVYRKTQQLFPANEVVASALTDTLVDLGRLPEAREALDHAELVVAPTDTKLHQIRNRLQGVLSGKPITSVTRSKAKEEITGDLSALTDITGSALNDAPALGLATLWRRQGHSVQAKAAWEALPPGPPRLIEEGLWHATTEGWSVAAAWFATQAPLYDGDGVLRVHRLRAQCRAGQAVDWSVEQKRYPYLLPIILTEEKGKPPHLSLDPKDEELTMEQRQDLWFTDLVNREDPALRDLAEEDLLASRHLL